MFGFPFDIYTKFAQIGVEESDVATSHISTIFQAMFSVFRHFLRQPPGICSCFKKRKATCVISWYFMVSSIKVFQPLCVHINSSGIPSGLDTVLMYDLCRNEWRPPTAARATAAGHQEEVLRAAVIPVTVGMPGPSCNLCKSLYIFVIHE